MQGKAWTGLLQKVPPEQHDLLVLMTTNGTEIVIQRLVRLDQDFLVALGRLSGSTEQGKVLVIPYDQLTYLAINKQLTDAQIDATLGTHESEATAESPPSKPHVNNQPAAASETAGGGAAVSLSPPAKPAGQLGSDRGEKASQIADTSGADKAPVKPDPKASPPSKTMLLARLRQRLADGAAKQGLRD
ncbi:MAG TPA: hypothetical protein VE988_03375 [Gemmataceae bacterium]|nr:hypothetical protein [Gemmataceae bacterium]